MKATPNPSPAPRGITRDAARLRAGIQAAFALVLAVSTIAVGGFWDSLAASFASTQLLPAVLRILGPGLSLAGAFPIATILMTILCGRIYCSTLCPLGAVMDLASRVTGLGRGRRRNRHRGRNSLFRWSFLALVVSGAAFGLPLLLELVEPFGILTRGLRAIALPVWAGMAALANLVARLGGGYGPAPVALEADLLVVGIASLSFAGIVLAAILRGRLFCDLLCPTGAVLELIAARSVLGISIGEDCISCGACATVCRASCIDLRKARVDRGRCVMCLSCLEACPNGSIRYERVPPRNAPAATTVPATHAPAAVPAPAAAPATAVGGAGDRISRRRFIGVSAAVLAGCAIPANLAVLAFPPALHAEVVLGGIRRRTAIAPGAASRARYLRRCTGCGLCVARCPTGVLRHGSPLATGASGALGFTPSLLPFMDYSSAWCSYDCTACAEVCPAGALSPLPLAVKRTVAVGESLLELSRCIVITKGTPCGACAEHCPSGAVTMRETKIGKPTEPFLRPEFCIGCGACETICPAIPLKAIWVDGRTTHGTARLPEGGKAEEADAGFAF